MPDYKGYGDLLKELNRIKRLTTLLRRNNLCVDVDAGGRVDRLYQGCSYGLETPRDLEDFPHDFNMDQLALENSSRIFIGNLVAENEQNTTY